MTNHGDGLRVDQSPYANSRTPSRKYERDAWFEKRKQLLTYLEAGANIRILTRLMKVSPTTIHHYFQRMYNEAELDPGHRSQPALLRVAYEKGWLPCPCRK